ncbi:MAG: glutathione S-transferase [bacterium]|jgi:glutathione S-transferase
MQKKIQDGIQSNLWGNYQGLTLYWASGSIPSWRVMLALEEKGLVFEARRLKVMSDPKETRLPEFLAINPRGQTPTLVDATDLEKEPIVVTQSLAILHYLENCYPEKSLLPVMEPLQLSKVLTRTQEAMEVISAYHGIDLLFNRLEKLNNEQKAKIQQSYQALPKELDFWEKYANETKFIAGEEFSLADCSFYPALAYICHRGFDLTDYSALTLYKKEVEKRESVERSRPYGWNHSGKNLFARYKEYFPEFIKHK